MVLRFFSIYKEPQKVYYPNSQELIFPETFFFGGGGGEWVFGEDGFYVKPYQSGYMQKAKKVDFLIGSNFILLFSNTLSSKTNDKM